MDIVHQHTRPSLRFSWFMPLYSQIYIMLLHEHFEAEACLNNIQEFNPYLKENTTQLLQRSVNAV
jgi:hypothetical protein